jgi:hypothetical protein
MNANDRWFISMWMCSILFAIHSSHANSFASQLTTFVAMALCAFGYIFTREKT